MKVHIQMCDSMEWKGQDYGWGDHQECGLPATWFREDIREYHCYKHKVQLENATGWEELYVVEIPDDTEIE